MQVSIKYLFAYRKQNSFKTKSGEKKKAYSWAPTCDKKPSYNLASEAHTWPQEHIQI